MPIECSDCARFLGDWRSHGPIFPDHTFEIVERRDWPIEGPGGMTGFDGVACCRTCARLYEFICTIPDGFAFTLRAR